MLTVKNNPGKPTHYFLAGPSCESDKRKSAEVTQQIHKEFEDVFNGIRCLEGTFSLQLKQIASHTRRHHNVLHMCSKSYSRKSTKITMTRYNNTSGG